MKSTECVICGKTMVKDDWYIHIRGWDPDAMPLLGIAHMMHFLCRPEEIR